MLKLKMQKLVGKKKEESFKPGQQRPKTPGFLPEADTFPKMVHMATWCWWDLGCRQGGGGGFPHSMCWNKYAGAPNTNPEVKYNYEKCNNPKEFEEQNQQLTQPPNKGKKHAQRSPSQYCKAGAAQPCFCRSSTLQSVVFPPRTPVARGGFHLTSRMQHNKIIVLSMQLYESISEKSVQYCHPEV